MHRLVVVDDEDRVIGIISLSDILLYLVLRPCGDDSSTNGISVRAHTTSISKSISDSELADNEMEQTIPEEDGCEEGCDEPTEENSLKNDVIEESEKESLLSTPTLETPSLVADNTCFREVTVSGGE